MVMDKTFIKEIVGNVEINLLWINVLSGLEVVVEDVMSTLIVLTHYVPIVTNIKE